MAYLDAGEIESAVTALAGTYPERCSAVELPHRSHEGRRILALQFGGAADAPAALLLGGVHAREMVPPDLMISLAADLLEAAQRGTGLRYGARSFSAEAIRSLLGTITLIVIPCVNPDGRQYCIDVDENWRKNRNATHGTGSSPCCGVDLNRNFPFLWDHLRKFAPNADVATSDQPCHPEQFRGDCEASEPETRNVIHVLDQHHRIRWMVDVHSHVPAIYHSWGSDEPQSANPTMNFLNPAFDAVRGLPDDSGYREYMPEADLAAARRLAATMQAAIAEVRGAQYEVAAAFALYATSGASDDYAYSRHFADQSTGKVLAYTVECGRRFWPLWPEAENVIRETSAGLIAFLLAAPGETSALFPTS